MQRHYAVVMCALLLLVAVGVGASASADHPERRCFSAAAWDANDAERPCASVTRIYEDGSVVVVVTDADGSKRYRAGIGALDR